MSERAPSGVVNWEREGGCGGKVSILTSDMMGEGTWSQCAGGIRGRCKIRWGCMLTLSLGRCLEGRGSTQSNLSRRMSSYLTIVLVYLPAD